MATTFTGLRVQNTYNAILKIGDNTNLTGTAKLLSDGFGNSSAIYLSTTSIGIGVTPSYQLHTSGNAKIGGNLIISGNLTVNGTLTYLNVIDLEVKDPLIKLATDNTANSLDIGFFGKYVSTGTRYKGLFNDASDDKFKLFLGTTIEPGTTVNTSGNGYTIGTLVANLEGNVTGGTISGTTGSFTGLVTGIAPTSALNFATKKYVDDSIPVIPGTPALSAVLAVGNTSGANNLKMADTKKILLGDDDDVEFFSNSAGYLINNTGNLYIENLANDRDISFICSDGNNGSSVYLFMDGSVQRNKFFQNTQVNDNITLGIGSDLDLNFKHDGSDSYIRNTKGNLNIYSDVDDGDITFNLDNGASPAVATVYMRLDGGDENIVFAKPISGTTGLFSGLVTGIAPTADLNFATKKYVDDSIPTVPGTPALSAVLAVGNTSGANNIIIADNQKVILGTDSDIELFFNSDGYIRNKTGDLYIQNLADDKSIYFQCDDGSGGVTEYMRIDGNVGKNLFYKTVVISNNLSPTLQLLDTNNNVSLQLIATDINASIGTYSAHPLIFVQNTGTVLTIDTSKNSTFVGNVSVIGTEKYIEVGSANTGTNFGFIGWNTASKYLFIGNSYSSAYNEDFVINNAGKIGIGTSTPNNKLSVQVNTDTRMEFWGSTTYAAMQSINDANSVLKQMRFDASSYWFNANNIGINNSDPAKKLEISSGTNADGILLTGIGNAMPTGSSRNIDFSYTSNDTSYASAIKFEVKDSTNHGGQIGFFTDAGPLSSASQGVLTRAMTINPNQNVGINIDNPDSKLDVRENANNKYTAYFYNNNTGANAHGINVQTAATNVSAYAFRVNSGTNSNALTVMGNARVGIGTASPQALLSLNQANGANIRFTNLTTNRFFTIGEGVGMDDRFSFRGNSYRSTDTLTVDFTNNRVGINQISPSNALSIKGVGNNYSTSAAIKLWDSLYDKGWYVGTANNSFAGDFYIRSVATESAYPVAADQQFTIKQDGSVGIGTIAPAKKLDVKLGDIRRSGFDSPTGFLELGSLPGYNANAYASLTSGSSLHFANNNKYCAYLEGANTYFGVLNSSSQTKVFLNTSGNSYLTGGNVGIGLTNPGVKLSVTTAGFTSAILIDNTDQNYTMLQINAQSATKGFMGFNSSFMIFGGESGTATRFQANGQYVGTFKTNGYFGVGTTNPLHILNVQAAADTIFSIWGDDNNYVGIQANNNANSALRTMRFDATEMHMITGKVGIGLTNPAAKLQVAGNINVINPNPYIWIGESNSGGLAGFIGWDDASNFLFIGHSYGSAFNKNIVINSSGYIGIGLTNPGRELDVLGVIRAQGQFHSIVSSTSTNLATASGGQLNLFNSNSTDGNFSNIGGYNSNSLVTSQINFINESHTSRTGAIGFMTHNGSNMPERMRIDNTGRTIIQSGTLTTPAYTPTQGYPLHVQGISGQCFISIGRASQTTGSAGVVVGLDTTTSYLWNRDNINITFGTNDSTKMMILAGGNVGINNPSPAKKLEISSSTSGDGILLTGIGASMATGSSRNIDFSYTDTDTSYASAMKFEIKDSSNHGGQISFWTDGGPGGSVGQGTSARAMTITPYQRIGIGTDSAESKLDVRESANNRYTAYFYNSDNGSQSNGVNVQCASTNNDTYVLRANAGGDSNALVVSGAGNVGIGKYQPGYKLDVTGTIRATSDIIAFSDKRVKENIFTINNALDKVTKLRGVSYKRSDLKDNKTKIGVIAQEVLNVLPEVVAKDDKGLYSVAYGNLAGVFIEAIKELKLEVDILKQEIKELKN